MIKKILILAIMLLLIESQNYSKTICECSQLLSEDDCITAMCTWNVKNTPFCQKSTPSNVPIKYSQYCSSYDEAICPKTFGCAWVELKCTFFTGCTPFTKILDSECQAISNRCITDGTHCVEIDACSTYKKQLPCVKNTAGSLCYWDTKNNTCVDANTCDKLPTTFITDKDCRDVISTCTTKIGGGCVDSQNKCSDQTLEIQCVWDKLKQIACYWDGDKCKDRICDNAPTSMNTDDACKTFRTDGTCTTKANGGCVTRTTCAAAAIEASCIKNSSGGDCYWTGTACVDKTCANAPVTMTTNSACAGFVTGCITKSGGGCVANGSCSVANVQAACVKNSSNFDCIWDTTCKEKTCANAPTTNNTHDLCTSYLSTCTVKSGGGCQNRSCANAPTTLTTNDACEAYLTANNCITKTGGGCVTNTTCAAITIEAACVQNSTGSSCFWDTASSSCKDKTCANAPKTNTTHDLCQAFLNTCTVNSTSAGCIEKTCENSLVLDACDKDINNKACIWKPKCYKKQCVLASSNTTTHADCQMYHSSCTLSNSGSGCVLLPLRCEAITLEAACKMKANKKPCGWNGSQCIKKACSTASKTFTTTVQCQEHLPICVVNNPVNINGTLTIQGCQDLPTTCAARKSTENCEIQRVGFPMCLWVASTSSCIEKSCATATNDETTGALSAGGLSHFACQAYLYTCILNNTGDGCIAKPSSCSSLVPSNCLIGSRANGDCYWNGSSCVDRTCENITQTTHSGCQVAFVQCTVNSGRTACQQLASSCASYVIEENCKITSTFRRCVWTGFSCRNANCADAPDYGFYDTDQECFNYPTPSETCTVIYKTGGQGCVPKSANCSDYMTMSQCHKTITNLTANDDCKWIVDRCYAISTFATGTCSSFKGTMFMCQQYKEGCTNTFFATSSVACFLDCTLIYGVSLTLQDCQAYDSTCSVRIDGFACINIQNSCSAYVERLHCFKSRTNYCAWTDYSYCSQVNQPSECSFVTGLINLDHTKCQLYHSSMALDVRSIRQLVLVMSATNNCATSGQGKCYFDGTDCMRFSNCASITGTGLTTTICATYDAGCIANVDGTACQEKLATCDLYLTQKSCSTSAAAATADKCAWSGTACLAIVTANIATHCAYVTGTGLTDTTCAAYNVDCTANRAGTACQEQKATCDVYTTEATCSTSKATATADTCAWSGTDCRAVRTAYIATDCGYVIGTGLTDAICASYNPDCTANRAGTACQEQMSDCELYVTWLSCSTSKAAAIADKCAWSGTACLAIVTANIATHCAYVTGTGLTDTICAAYNADCTANRAGTACQEQKATCDLYFTEATCSTSKAAATADKCVWSGTACLRVTVVDIHCAYVTETRLSDAICAQYNVECTVNKARTACQKKISICNEYADYSTCSQSFSSLCVWNGTSCISVTNATTDCEFITEIRLTDQICSMYNSGCISLKDGTACQEAKYKCQDYTTFNKCTIQTNDSRSCIWIDNSCYPISGVNCGAITGSGLDHAQCQAYSLSCTSIADGTRCQDFKQTCEQYPGTLLECTKSFTQKCYLVGSTCITISDATTHCSKIFGAAGAITYEICQSYNPGCSVNRSRNACVLQQAQCYGYTELNSCYKSAAGLCITKNGGATCVAASSAATCEAIELGSGNYSSANCNEIKAGCTNNGTTGCVAKTCANAVDITFNHANCNNWINICTVNSGNTGCLQMAFRCADQTQSSCLYSVEGECEIVGSSCVRRTCDTAPADINYDTDTECSSYLQSCTVARSGGCQVRKACASYKSQIQCKLSSSGAKCFWNPTYKTCVDLTCSNIEATSLFDTHNKCVAVDSSLACTVKQSNGVAVPGCVERSRCSLYIVEEQCKTDANGGACFWNTDATVFFPVCQDMSCSHAPTDLSTHNECYAYYNTPTVKCTVAIQNINSGDRTLGGCQQTAACQTYMDKEQCQINANGDPCGWNGIDCADKSCKTAPATSDYDDDTKCRGYITNKCTVSDSGQGCVDIPATCETMTQKQCYYNKAGDPCYWTGTACITKQCENAPDATATADDCNTYFTGCTLDSVKCKTKVCEDFAYATDDTCKQAISKCTTNGIICVTRGSCLQALDKAGCVTSSTGDQCEWVFDTEDDQWYCTIKTCSTAPSTLLTEQLCKEYLPICTTKKGGGCVKKSTCQAANVESACTTSLNGQICAWDGIKHICRVQECQDLEGSLHSSCQARRLDCTAGVHGKCAKIQNCEQTTVRAACINGLNGQCLWIEQYINQDGSQGACFSYTSCQSLKWTSDQQCKQISDKCTTDGSKCVAITSCSETNTNGGCVTGYDGICMQSVRAFQSVDPEICKIFVACVDAFYLTHEECQRANSGCTTNGLTGCIQLGECSSYNSKAACVKNKNGPQIATDGLTSTGLCTWDSDICRNQVCSDYYGTTHQECSNFLSACTTNGKACILKNQCSSYTDKETCEEAVGSNGNCIWEIESINNNYKASCRVFTCQDIQIQQTNECLTSSLSCVLDNNICIPKANCSTYTSKTACNSGGISNQICVFEQQSGQDAILGIGTCTLMTECSTANNDQNACQAAKDRCYWKPAEKINGSNTRSSCSTLTCDTNYKQTGYCTRFYNWDKNTKQQCSLTEGKCSLKNPSTLSQSDCFKVSEYTYTWNTETSRCQVCTEVKVDNNTNQTDSNSDNPDENQETTSSNLILRIIGIIVIDHLIL
ncbi:unnamed protein product (macronuclear) [Paramecium tetraurelia]|uniref:PSI domain-containing protein n=1 Tax=Paramecium tetraurelia TaxID=5888 RepID=A0DIG0_PARTE|nr:uncharacterized protein GSPATT00017199001 [Paramecium tetraurelia]CAK82827.1 unnamed protein product [Paramecium tetraurelia]|eukprot:XP_001450224.1 hypothetical protein (macronuclear) [Paramecium tetraurelia strain d4-2]